MRPIEEIAKDVEAGRTITADEWNVFMHAQHARRINALEKLVGALRVEIDKLRSSDIARNM